MKTIIKITEDNYSDIAFIQWKEDINYLVNEVDVFCQIANNKYNNRVEKEKRYSSTEEDYKNTITIIAKGYSQSEWQEYTLHYNENELITPQQRTYFSDLIKQLERTFTHKHSYSVEKFEQTEIEGKTFNAEPHDYDSFCISHTEFPDKVDIEEEYNARYGIDYDIMIIDVD
jgi:hypothetical protein